jgi:phospholipid/cholesterol/gamma-HCH transport system ATP-binding protein
VTSSETPIVVEDVTIAYGATVIQRDLSFAVRRGEIFVIMGAAAAARRR